MIEFVIGFLVYIIVALLFLLAKIHWVDPTKDDFVDCMFWPLYIILLISGLYSKLFDKGDLE